MLSAQLSLPWSTLFSDCSRYWERSKQWRARPEAQTIHSTKEVSNCRKVGIRKVESVENWCICRESSLRKCSLSTSSEWRTSQAWTYWWNKLWLCSVWYSISSKLDKKIPFKFISDFQKYHSQWDRYQQSEERVCGRGRFCGTAQATANMKLPLNQWISHYFFTFVFLTTGFFLQGNESFRPTIPRNCFNCFLQSAVNARRQNDVNSSSSVVAETMTLFTNSFHGYQLMDLSKQTVRKNLSYKKLTVQKIVKCSNDWII